MSAISGNDAIRMAHAFFHASLGINSPANLVLVTSGDFQYSKFQLAASIFSFSLSQSWLMLTYLLR